MNAPKTIAWMAATAAIALAGMPAGAETVYYSSADSQQEAVPAFALENGEEIEDLEGYAGTAYYFRFYIPEGTRELEIESDGDEALLRRGQEDLESAIRLARMNLSELQGLPLPSQ